MLRPAIFAAAALLLPVMVLANAPAQDQGEQLRQGQAIYATKCAACHGMNLAGGAGPALRPIARVKALKPRATAADFATYIKLNMPVSDPGSLSSAQSLAVSAYILKQGGTLPPGAALTAPAAAALKVK